MWSAKITVTEAAREGARVAALVSEDQGAQRVHLATSGLGTRVPRYLLGGPEARARWSPGSVRLVLPVVWMIRGVLSPVSVAPVDR
jgi:hypothetical protein